MTSSTFAKQVVNNFENGIGIFSNKNNVEDSVPSGMSSLQVSLFMFYVVQLDYATKSQRLYKGANRLFHHKEDFFTPNFILNLGKEELYNYLTEYLHPRYANEAVERYTTNSKSLIDKYKGKPINIFTDSARESLGKVLEFRGFGPKTGNLYFRAMTTYFGFEFPDIEDVLPPVDIHDVRIAYQMGYVGSDGMSPKNINLVKQVWSDACKEAGVSWMVFDRALWIMGSQGQPRDKQDVQKLIVLQ